jgi:hypothetical protein
LVGGEAAQMLGHHVVLALALGEQHHEQPMAGGKPFRCRDKPPAHRGNQHRGRQGLSALLAKEADRPMGALQPRDIDVQVHPVDRFDCQLAQIGENSGDALCYHPAGSGRAVLPLQRAPRPLIGPLETGFLPELVRNWRSEPPQHASSV